MAIDSLLYVGSMQPPEDATDNRWGSMAFNQTQLAMLQALHNEGVTQVIGLSFPGSSAWGEKRVFKRAKRTTICAGVEIREMPFVSLGPLQPLSQMLMCALSLLRHLQTAHAPAVMVSIPHTRFTLPALLIGKLLRVPVVLFVADMLPADAPASWLNRLRWAIRRWLVKQAPAVLVLSSHVGRDLRGTGLWKRITLPPSSDILALPLSTPDPATPIAFYGGTLAEVTGVDLLLAAITCIAGARYRFWITGRGPLDSAVRQVAANDPRITFWGVVSHAQYLDLLSQATVLINPRPSSLPENRYNFPSKLIEYMASGKPVISTLTSDAAAHYGSEIVQLVPETPRQLAALIEAVCAWPEEQRGTLGQQARNKVQSEHWQAQAQHILSLIGALQ